MTQPNGQGPAVQEFQLRVLDEAVAKSVETPEDIRYTPGVAADRYGLMWFAAAFADEITTWGQAPSVRDAQLKAFLPKESIAASAFASTAMKYAQMSWKLAGPERSQNAGHDVLIRAEWGAGWQPFVATAAMEFLTSDKGAFIEMIRTEDNPAAPVVGIRSLESACCWPTGNPEQPVIFYDRIGGKYHRMKWYQVYQLLEMPIKHPTFHGLQYSALTRVLAGAQLWRNVNQYMTEKTGGRHTRAIHVINGISKLELDDAMTKQQMIADNRLEQRYIQPVIVTALNQDKPSSVATLELATIPEGFDQKEQFSEYIAILALALGTDYGELAPLPGNALGTATQSETMDEKSRKKGVGYFRKLMAHFINNFVLPANVTFEFDEEDLAEETQRAEAQKTRAEGRAVMVTSGELDAAGARQLALDAGDIPQELFDAMAQRDLTEQAIRDEEREKVTRELAAATVVPRAPASSPPPAAGTSGTAPMTATSKELRAGPDEERLQAEDEAAAIVEDGLSIVFKNVRARLQAG